MKYNKIPKNFRNVIVFHVADICFNYKITYWHCAFGWL